MPNPKIDSNKCDNCGKCIELCPMGVFAKEEGEEGKVVVKKPQECIGCKACEVQCPKEAIKVED